MSSEDPDSTAAAVAHARGRSPDVKDTTPPRGREHAPSTHRSRSRSRLRKPKLAGSKLKGMVKSGWKSFKRSSSSRASSSSNASASDVASKDTFDSVALLNTATTTALLDSSNNDKKDMAPTTTLELVVLLMDPLSRRFELLQLEFDSSRAKVSDLLTQIPLSVTEPALQEQPYVGVLDSSGNVQEGSTRLLQAFASSDTNKAKMVLVAKPKGISTKETMRLAKPILTDAQVSKMLQATGFNVDGWKSKRSSGAPVTSRRLDDIPNTERVVVGGAVGGNASTTSSHSHNSSNSSLLSMALIAVALSVMLSSVHTVLTKPIEIDTLVKYGTTKYKCGIVSFVPPLAKDVAKTLLEPFQPDIQTNTESMWNCQNEYFAVSKEGITIANADGEVLLDMTVNANVNCKDAKKNKDCVDGLLLSDDKTLKMGTDKLKSGTAFGYDNIKLSPWPFAVPPKVNIYKRASQRTS